MLKQSPMQSELRERHPARVWALAEAGLRDIHRRHRELAYLASDGQRRIAPAICPIASRTVLADAFNWHSYWLPRPRVERFVENADVGDDALLCCQHDHLDDDHWLYRRRLRQCSLIRDAISSMSG